MPLRTKRRVTAMFSVIAGLILAFIHPSARAGEGDSYKQPIQQRKEMPQPQSIIMSNAAGTQIIGEGQFIQRSSPSGVEMVPLDKMIPDEQERLHFIEWAAGKEFKNMTLDDINSFRLESIMKRLDESEKR